MCGIIGINQPDKRAVVCGADAMAHRGPDARGLWGDDTVMLGHNRLSIIDLDTRATQPLWDADKKMCVVYNGEIYNYRELQADLEREFRFVTTSDTEVLLYGHKKYGPNFIKKLRGMYAYAVYDSVKQRLTLVRDHAGIKPLYYYFDGNVFAFASEMKALCALLREKGVQLTTNEQALHFYWALGYIPSPYTLWTNISVVPRSSVLTFDLASKKLKIEPYSIETQPVETESELFDLIERKILEHLVADVPVGLFFSGGTDSSLIATVLKRHNRQLEAFSVHVEGRDGDAPYFKAIRDHLALSVETVPFGSSEFGDVYEIVMDMLDVPLADNSIFPSYFVARKAAERVKVVLSGEGGDELFFGYQRQRSLARMRNKRRPFGYAVDRVLDIAPIFKGKGKLRSLAHGLVGDPYGYYINEISPAREFLEVNMRNTVKTFLHEAAPDPLYLDRDVYLENDLLRKTDMATMFNSIEGRVPLLDPDVMASAPKFESAFIQGEHLKPVLKRMLLRDLPSELVYRKKSGFGISPRRHLNESPAFRDDLSRALRYFDEIDILAPRLPGPDALLEQSPDTAFAAVALYRVHERDSK